MVLDKYDVPYATESDECSVIARLLLLAGFGQYFGRKLAPSKLRREKLFLIEEWFLVLTSNKK